MSAATEALELVQAAKLDTDSMTAFAAAVRRSLDALGGDPVVLANDLAVSRSTVLRWASGASVPHPVMRKPVYAALTRRLLAAEGGTP